MRAFKEMLCVLLVLVTGCDPVDSNQPDGGPVDGGPLPVQYENFAATTWSMAMVDGRYQISITDGTGAAACALSLDHANSLDAAGHQLILSVPGPTGTPCPNGSYPMNTSCGTNVGADAAVPASCAFYRQFDAGGALSGIASSINGEITISGSTGSCSIRANVGFLGGSFAMMSTLTDGQGAQPWCE